MNKQSITQFFLNQATWEQLRWMATMLEIPRGQNKRDTIQNLSNHMSFSAANDQLTISITIPIPKQFTNHPPAPDNWSIKPEVYRPTLPKGQIGHH